MESECRYVANEDDRRAIGASETITELRRVVRGLRGRVEECYSGSGPGGGTGNHPGAGTGTGTGEEEEDLMVVYEALQTAAPEGVYLLVEMLRSGKEIGDVACLAREYLGLID